jgi:hypothetical protein
MKQEDMIYSKALSRRNRVVCVDIVEVVWHGKKRRVANACEEDGRRHLVYEFCLLRQIIALLASGHHDNRSLPHAGGLHKEGPTCCLLPQLQNRA